MKAIEGPAEAPALCSRHPLPPPPPRSQKTKHWENIARDRDSWRTTTKRGAKAFEAARKEAVEEKDRRRKSSTAQSPPTQGFPCSLFARVCCSRLGLHNHQRICHRLSSNTRNLPTTCIPVVAFCQVILAA